jgi:two-component system, NtrC family, nitrogen regulation response regulator GlnG
MPVGSMAGHAPMSAAESWSAAPATTYAPGTLVGGVSAATAVAPVAGNWLSDLEREARTLLDAGQADVWDHLTKLFEARLIHTALELTRGRRIEAAQKLGIGRNTITRKIQELGMDD